MKNKKNTLNQSRRTFLKELSEIPILMFLSSCGPKINLSGEPKNLVVSESSFSTWVVQGKSPSELYRYFSGRAAPNDDWFFSSTNKN